MRPQKPPNWEQEQQRWQQHLQQCFMLVLHRRRKLLGLVAKVVMFALVQGLQASSARGTSEEPHKSARGRPNGVSMCELHCNVDSYMFKQKHLIAKPLHMGILLIRRLLYIACILLVTSPLPRSLPRTPSILTGCSQPTWEARHWAGVDSKEAGRKSG